MDSTNSYNSYIYSTPTRASKCPSEEYPSCNSTAENSNPCRSPTYSHPLNLPSISISFPIQTFSLPSSAQAQPKTTS